MARSSVKAEGVRQLMAELKQIGRKAEDIADEEAEKFIRNVASDASKMAPVDTGKLSNSLPAGVEREGSGIWVIRDGTDYTLVQEYTHKTKKAFIRTAVWDNEGPAEASIRARFAREGE
ncbi:HK97 gp10 family phage protein [Terribacillus sp. 179-K 1B1 HS]|uniref:HK97 gp10 family phage protein n=1 Tax=Terribacillus sp. 179-K 1B1 HS TaxID=3142388 RepID=UPI0039A09426